MAGGLNSEGVKDLMARIQRRRDVAREVRDYYALNWAKNFACLFGKPYYKLSPSGDLVFAEVYSKAPGAVKRRQLIPANLMYSAYNNMASKLLDVPTQYRGIPCSKELRDETNARIAERLLNAILSPQLERLKENLIWWMLWTGKPLLKLYYRRTNKISYPDWTYEETPYPLLWRDIGEDRDGEVVEDGKPLYWKVSQTGEKAFKELWDGNVVVDVISPFEYLIDPQARSLSIYDPHRAKWIIQEQALTIEEVEELIDGTGIKLDQVAFTETGEDILTQTLQKASRKTPLVSERCAIYQEYWQLPSRRYPEGVYARTIGGQLLSYAPLPRPFRGLRIQGEEVDILPYFDFSDVTTPYGWYPHTLLDKVRPLHKLYSLTLSKLLENIEKTGTIDLISHDTLRPQKVSDDVIDRVYTITTGNPPVPIVLDRIPMTLIRLLEVLRADMELIFLHDVRYPLKERTLGETMAIIEEDEKRMNRIRNSMMSKFTEMGLVAIQMMQIYYPPNKKLRILGDANQWEVYTFQTSSIEGNWDITIGMGHPPYLTPTGIVARIAQLKDLGIKIDATELINLFGVKQFVEPPDTRLDLREAEKENLRILKARVEKLDGNYRILDLEMGTELVLKVDDWENDEVHIDSHNTFLKKHNEQLNPIVVEVLVKHVEEHQEQLVRKAMRIQALADKIKKEFEESSPRTPTEVVSPLPITTEVNNALQK